MIQLEVVAPIALRPPLFEHTVRTKIRCELATLNNLFKLPYNDIVTGKIIRWHGEFVQAVHRESGNLDLLIRDHCSRLREILHDEINGFPYEKKSYLGSDGYVYGKKALLYYMNQMPEEIRGRSPKKRESEDLFFVIRRHEIVEGAYNWLELYEMQESPLSCVLDSCNQLKTRGLLPVIPGNLKKAERLQCARMLAKEEKIRAEREAEIREKAREDVLDHARARVDEAFAPFAGALDRLRHREARVLHAARLKDVMNEAFLRREEAEWRERIDELRLRQVDLDHRVDLLTEGLGAKEVRVEQLKKEIAETTRKHNEKGGGHSFWSVTAQIASYAAFAYTGYSISTSEGGGVINILWKV